MTDEVERLFGRDRLELEAELDDTRDTLRELHSLARAVHGVHPVERRAVRALRFVEQLTRDVRQYELDGRRRGALSARDRMKVARRS